MARQTFEIDGFTFDIRNPDEVLVGISESDYTDGYDTTGHVMIPYRTLVRLLDKLKEDGWVK